VQEICDRIGILANGGLVREGALSVLLGVENQTQLILENASAELVDEIGTLATRSGARLIECGRPRTSLERLFLEATESPDKNAHE
jgi:ABC-2 type transport system ATP-binding protein